MLTSPEILVPIDFSPCSVNALRVAIGMAAPEGDLTLLHVVDEEFIKAAVAAGMGSTEEIIARLKEQAESNFTSDTRRTRNRPGQCRKDDGSRFAFCRDSEDCARSRSADDCDGNKRTGELRLKNSSSARPLRKFCVARACRCFACHSNVQL